MRVKGGFTTRRRHKKILKSVKGYRGARRRLYRIAKESFLHSGQYALHGRRKRLGQMRKLWILRLNAALRSKSIKYSDFIHRLRLSDIQLNRKMMSELAINHANVFDKLVDTVIA
ncbi:MAG: 50S ribosomal protein L20 [Candidatus Dojkabacteria bacterium]|jgi:large subunit ribosomal protein L20|nr:MAG: 50S ribosomal protein L20 [Candidatus Dojkabacteria bacterium]